MAVEKDLSVSIDLKLRKNYDPVAKKYSYDTKSVANINPAVSSDVLYALGEKLGAFFDDPFEYGFGGVVRKESFFIEG